MPYYNVRLQSDSGIVRIKTFAKDRDTAIENVMAAEGCPRGAVLSASSGGGRWINAKLLPYKSNKHNTLPVVDFHNQD